MVKLMDQVAMMKRILILVMECHKSNVWTETDKESESLTKEKTMFPTWKEPAINNK